MRHEMVEDVVSLVKPASVHRLSTTIRRFSSSSSNASLVPPGFMSATKARSESRRLFLHACRTQADRGGARPRRSAARSAQPVCPPRRHGGRARQRPDRRIPMLLSRLDLSSRRPPEGSSAATWLSGRLRSEKPVDGHAACGRRVELSRLYFRQSIRPKDPPWKIGSAI